MLKSLIMGGLETTSNDLQILNSTAFMTERLDSLSHSCLASRLAINCAPSYVQTHLVNDLPVTILDVWDQSALSEEVKEDVYKCYPRAKKAHLKSGGNFPFLSRSDEVNMHIMVGLDQSVYISRRVMKPSTFRYICETLTTARNELQLIKPRQPSHVIKHFYDFLQ